MKKGTKESPGTWFFFWKLMSNFSELLGGRVWEKKKRPTRPQKDVFFHMLHRKGCVLCGMLFEGWWVSWQNKWLLKREMGSTGFFEILEFCPSETIMQDSNICRSWSFFFWKPQLLFSGICIISKNLYRSKKKNLPGWNMLPNIPPKITPFSSHHFHFTWGILVQVKESMKVFMPCSYVELRVVRCFGCYDQIINLWIKSLVLQPQQCWEIGRQWNVGCWMVVELPCSKMEFSNDIVIGYKLLY